MEIVNCTAPLPCSVERHDREPPRQTHILARPIAHARNTVVQQQVRPPGRAETPVSVTPLVDSRQQKVHYLPLGIARAKQRAPANLLERGAALLALRKQLQLAGENTRQEHRGRRAQPRKDQHHAGDGLHEQARLVVVIEAGDDAHRLFRDEGEGGGVEDGVEDALQGRRLREDAGGVVEVEDGLDLGEALGEEAEEAGLGGDREAAQVESEGVDRRLDAR